MSGAGALSLPVLRVALYEGLGAEPLDRTRRVDLLRTLLDRGYRVTRVRSGRTAAAVRAELAEITRSTGQRFIITEADARFDLRSLAADGG